MDDLRQIAIGVQQWFDANPHALDDPNEVIGSTLRDDILALAAGWTKPSVAQQVEPIQNKCFECGHELQAPLCPACNPELAIVWRDPPAQQPPSEAAPYWLVERNKGEWLYAHRVANAPEWTRDHTKAWRFSSKLGAEAQAARYPLITMGVSVTEHAEEPEPAPVKMLVDADWLREKVAADPDMDCEVRPAPDWRAFSDAPKTGELVDLWVSGHRVADARYSVTRDCWLTSHDTIVIGVPTHFMFRPKAPREGV